MNGWMRLWVFVSIVWVALIVSIGVTHLPEDYDQESKFNDIFLKLSDQTKEFYKDNRNIYDKPRYVLPIKHLNGEEYKVRFDFMNNEEEEIMKKRLSIYQREKKEISDPDFKNLLDAITIKNKEAFSAAQEFDAVLESFKLESLQKRNESIFRIIFVAIVPSILALLFGQGVAWVRRGFQLNK